MQVARRRVDATAVGGTSFWGAAAIRDDVVLRREGKRGRFAVQPVERAGAGAEDAQSDIIALNYERKVE